MGRSIVHHLGSPRRPVACAICAVRGLSVDQLLDLCELGVDFVQLRDREASDRECERFLDTLASRSGDVLSRIVVNDRLALAGAFPVAGVHLPEAGLSVAAVRSRFPRGRLLIGRSVHGVDAAAAAEKDGADYVILGPVAPTGESAPFRRRSSGRPAGGYGFPSGWSGGWIRKTSITCAASGPPDSPRSVPSVTLAGLGRSSPAAPIWGRASKLTVSPS